MWKEWELDLSGLRQGRIGCCCEHGIELSRSGKDGQYVDQLGCH